MCYLKHSHQLKCSSLFGMQELHTDVLKCSMHSSKCGRTMYTEHYDLLPLRAQRLYDNSFTVDLFDPVRCRYFHDFQKRIPREEMVQLQEVTFSHIKKEDENFVATVCGSFRRGG